MSGLFYVVNRFPCQIRILHRSALKLYNVLVHLYDLLKKPFYRAHVEYWTILWDKIVQLVHHYVQNHFILRPLK